MVASKIGPGRSGIFESVWMIAGELAIAERSALPGTLLPPSHELEQSIRGERLTRKAERRNRALDGVGLALDLDQIIHPRVALEPDGRSIQLVLDDLAIYLAGEDEADALEDLAHCVGVGRRQIGR